MYQLLKGIFILPFALLRGVQGSGELVRQVGPGIRPLSEHEWKHPLYQEGVR